MANGTTEIIFLQSLSKDIKSIHTKSVCQVSDWCSWYDNGTSDSKLNFAMRHSPEGKIICAMPKLSSLMILFSLWEPQAVVCSFLAECAVK